MHPLWRWLGATPRYNPFAFPVGKGEGDTEPVLSDVLTMNASDSDPSESIVEAVSLSDKYFPLPGQSLPKERGIRGWSSASGGSAPC